MSRQSRKHERIVVPSTTPRNKELNDLLRDKRRSGAMGRHGNHPGKPIPDDSFFDEEELNNDSASEDNRGLYKPEG